VEGQSRIKSLIDPFGFPFRPTVGAKRKEALRSITSVRLNQDNQKDDADNEDDEGDETIGECPADLCPAFVAGVCLFISQHKEQ